MLKGEMVIKLKSDGKVTTMSFDGSIKAELKSEAGFFKMEAPSLKISGQRILTDEQCREAENLLTKFFVEGKIE